MNNHLDPHLLNPVDLIGQYAAALSLDVIVVKRAVEFWQKFNCTDASNSMLKKFQAAAALYFAALLSNVSRTQREIAIVAGCSQGALIIACKKMKKELW